MTKFSKTISYFLFLTVFPITLLNATEEVSLSIVGDLMCHMMQIHYAQRENGFYDFYPQFETIAPYLKEADCTIGNLETTISNANIGYFGYPLFRTPGAYVKALKEAGFDLLTTINNHSLDGASFGIDNTISVIRSYRLAQTGTFLSTQDPTIPLIYKVKGITFAFIAFTHSLNCNEHKIPPKELPHRYVLIQDKKRVIQTINNAKAKNPNFIIAFVHWGDEYFLKPNKEQKEQAQFLAEHGVDIIMGSHPHVPQPLELILVKQEDGLEKKVPVIFSLGNFIANMSHLIHPHSDIGIILNLYFAKKEIESSDLFCIGEGEYYLKSIDYIPSWCHIFEYKNPHQERCKKGFEVIPLFEDDTLLPNTQHPLSSEAKERYKEAYKDVTTQMNREWFMPKPICNSN